MKVQSKYKGKIYEYEYPDGKYENSFRSIKFDTPEQFPKFSKICKDRGTNARREINAAVNYVIENGVLISEVING